MTRDEFSKTCEVYEVVKGIKNDLMERIDLDAYEEAHRDLTVAKLDLALTKIASLQNLYFINKCQKVVDEYNNGGDTKDCNNSPFDDEE